MIEIKDTQPARRNIKTFTLMSPFRVWRRGAGFIIQLWLDHIRSDKQTDWKSPKSVHPQWRHPLLRLWWLPCQLGPSTKSIGHYVFLMLSLLLRDSAFTFTLWWTLNTDSYFNVTFIHEFLPLSLSRHLSSCLLCRNNMMSVASH